MFVLKAIPDHGCSMLILTILNKSARNSKVTAGVRGVLHIMNHHRKTKDLNHVETIVFSGTASRASVLHGLSAASAREYVTVSIECDH